MWHVASWWNLFLFAILLILSSIRNWFWSDNFFSHYTWYYQKRILWIKFKHCLTTLFLCLSIWTCIQVVWCLYSALWCVKICGLGVVITKCIFLFLCTHFLENPLHFVVILFISYCGQMIERNHEKFIYNLILSIHYSL